MTNDKRINCETYQGFNPTVGAFLHLNGVQLAKRGDRFGKDGGGLEDIGGGKVEGAIA